jgi:hypothetical protein
MNASSIEQKDGKSINPLVLQLMKLVSLSGYLKVMTLPIMEVILI